MGIYGADYFTSPPDNNIVSADNVSYYSNYYNGLYINESSTDLLLENNVTSALSKLGVEEPDKIAREIKDASNLISNDIKKHGIIKGTYKSISSIIESTITDITVNIETSANDPNYVYATKLLISTIIVNTITITVASTILGPFVGSKLGVFIINPIVNEMSKKIAVKYGYDEQYNKLYNTYQISSTAITGGIEAGFLKMIKIKLSTVGAHISTTITNLISNNEQLRKLFKVDNKSEDSEKTSKFVGKLLGTIIKGSWNASVNIVIKAL